MLCADLEAMIDQLVTELESRSSQTHKFSSLWRPPLTLENEYHAKEIQRILAPRAPHRVACLGHPGKLSVITQIDGSLVNIYEGQTAA